MGGGTPLIVKFDHDEVVNGNTLHFYDKTWQQVKDAYDAGTSVFLQGKQPLAGYDVRYQLAKISAEEPKEVTFAGTALNDAFATIIFNGNSPSGALYTTEIAPTATE